MEVKCGLMMFWKTLPSLPQSKFFIEYLESKPRKKRAQRPLFLCLLHSPSNKIFLVSSHIMSHAFSRVDSWLNRGWIKSRYPVRTLRPTRLEFNLDKTVLLIFSFDRQKFGWHTEMEQADCPHWYRVWPLNKIYYTFHFQAIEAICKAKEG